MNGMDGRYSWIGCVTDISFAEFVLETMDVYFIVLTGQATAEDVFTHTQSTRSTISSHGGIHRVPYVFEVGERKPRR
ncbi:hypothetical protein [Paenibacillus sp. TSA_86.1]|uniref:hypothetical protein n=1 Tax=Paenibacillus sp. TSA_86.1 TaxID=3415649 RepID=UPI0040453541